jgi:nucleoside-diphosphate-sugar epimerase
MNVLIIGGNSSIGKVLIDFLSKFSKVFTAGRINCDFHIDLNDSIENINLPYNLNAIIITSAHFGGDSDKDFYEAENINVMGALKICQVAKQVQCKHIIFISSIFTLLSKTAKNYSIYSLSKKHAEEVIELYCNKYDLPLTILRPSQLYGNIENFHIRQPFLNMILDKAEKGDEINFYGSHDAKINIIHIDDLANIISLVVKNKILGVFSCTNPKDITYAEFAKVAYELSNQEIKINFNSNLEDIPDNIFFNDKDLYEKINYFPKVKLREGIKGVYKFRKAFL